MNPPNSQASLFNKLPNPAGQPVQQASLQAMREVVGPSSFAVGPSRIEPAIKEYFIQGYEEGILSVNHRDERFKQMWKHLCFVLRQKLDIPADFHILCCDSATACWDLVLRCFSHKGSLHAYNGDFGKKWMLAAERLSNSISKKVGRLPFPLQTTLKHYIENEANPLVVEQAAQGAYDLLACTHNETSTGSMCDEEDIDALCHLCAPSRKRSLVALDATSSLSAVHIPWHKIDICFASVQKGLGMPAGMALLCVSPAAHSRAQELGEDKHYNSYLRLVAHYQQAEAPYTPNIMGIYLLGRVLEARPPIQLLHEQTLRRWHRWIDFLDTQGYQRLLPFDGPPASPTIIAFADKGTRTTERLYDLLRGEGLPLSHGYGNLRGRVLRMANFPAIQDEEIERLRNFLAK